MKKEWFESWFDTIYYHKLYNNRDNKEANFFILNLISYLKPNKSAKILDLACGKGRHSVILNKLGYNVLGVDLSPSNIQYANQYQNKNLRFAIHDMRKTIENESFNFIFNLFTSFGYFKSKEENKNVLISTNTMLENDGIIIIDFMNSKKIIANLIEKEVKVIDGIKYQISREHDDNYIHKYIKINDKGNVKIYKERVQSLDQADFKKLLDECNFQIIDTFGDFKLSNFNEEKSDRLIIIAKKRAA